MLGIISNTFAVYALIWLILLRHKPKVFMRSLLNSNECHGENSESPLHERRRMHGNSKACKCKFKCIGYSKQAICGGFLYNVILLTTIYIMAYVQTYMFNTICLRCGYIRLTSVITYLYKFFSIANETNVNKIIVSLF